MHSRKLIDWIRSKEAKGLSDSKVKNRLLKGGWPEKDIDYAINYAHKGKVNWMPLLLLFIGSLILFFVVNSISESGEWVFIFLLGSLIAFFYSLVPYFKSNKKEWFTELLIINYSSGLFALALTFFLFNLIVFIIYLTNLSVTIPLIIILVSLCIIFLFYVFFFTIENISKHFVGYFDYESYFVFKHWPFKIFNVNWKKKWTLLKYPVIVIVIGLIIAGFMFNGIVNDKGKSITSDITSLQEFMKNQFFNDCLDNIWVTNNLSFEESFSVPILKKEDEYIYDSTAFLDIDTIFYECNLNSYTCMKKDFDPSKKIEEQLVLGENYNSVSKVSTTEQTYILVLNDNTYSNEDLISCSNFNIDERESQFEFIQGFIEEKKTFLLNIFEKEVPEVTWFNFIELTKQNILEYTKFSFGLSVLNHKEEIIYHELGPVDNLNKEIMIYDNSTTFPEHIDQLNENIKILYPKYLAIEPKDESFYGFGLFEIGYYSYGGLLSTEVSAYYLISKLLRAEEFVNDLIELKDYYAKNIIKEFYQTKDIEESLESKAIRLKIIETLLAKKIVSDDGGQEEEISAITKTPELLK